MALKVWQFVAAMLVAFALSAAVAHAMELLPKLGYEPRLYVLLHRTLYVFYGGFSGFAEAFAVFVLLGVAWRVRRDGVRFKPMLISATLMLVAHLVFWIWVQPANTTMKSWSLDAIPPDWTVWRNQWEYAHASRAVLIVASFAALLVTLLRGASSAASVAAVSNRAGP